MADDGGNAQVVRSMTAALAERCARHGIAVLNAREKSRQRTCDHSAFSGNHLLKVKLHILRHHFYEEKHPEHDTSIAPTTYKRAVVALGSVPCSESSNPGLASTIANMTTPRGRIQRSAPIECGNAVQRRVYIKRMLLVEHGSCRCSRPGWRRFTALAYEYFQGICLGTPP